MNLKQDNYIITKETLRLILEALEAHQFDGGGYYSNDEVIEAQKALDAEIDEQDTIESNLAIPNPGG